MLDLDFSNLHPLTVWLLLKDFFISLFLDSPLFLLPLFYAMHVSFIIPVRPAWQLGNLLFAELQKASDGPHSSPSVLPLHLAAFLGSGPWFKCVGSAVFHQSGGD